MKMIQWKQILHKQTSKQAIYQNKIPYHHHQPLSKKNMLCISCRLDPIEVSSQNRIYFLIIWTSFKTKTIQKNKSNKENKSGLRPHQSQTSKANQSP